MTNLILNGNSENTNNGSTLGVPESSTSTTSSSKLYVPGQEGIVTPNKELWVPKTCVPREDVGYPSIIIQGTPAFRKLKALYLDEDGTLYNSIDVLQECVMKLIKKLELDDISSDALRSRERAIMRQQHEYNEMIAARCEGREPTIPDFNNPDALAEILQNAKLSGDIDDRVADAIYDLERAKRDLRMLKEARDTFLEVDGKKPKGTPDIIPYDLIYSEQYWHPGLAQNTSDIVKFFGPSVWGYSAHNGIDDMHGREYDEKSAPLSSRGLETIGLRFHGKEHIENEIRDRNPKGQNLMRRYGFRNLNGHVICEDTLEVCREMYSLGATVIYVNRKGIKSDEGFYTVDDVTLDILITALEELGFASDDDYVYRIPNDEKSKVKVKAA